ncbi:Cytochrome c oxidase subunit 2 [bacterium HR21]|nr:Cytochrome c oxidase subunit 2 [bacterium HR21]
MERSERLVMGIGIAVMAVFFALVLLLATGFGVDVPGCITEMKPFEQDTVFQTAEKRYEMHVIARMWSYQMPPVEFPVGSTVDIYLTSGDVVHGFHIDRTNVNLMAVPGTVTYARVRFRTPGEYPIVCHEYCGIGHQQMVGVIRVVQ